MKPKNVIGVKLPEEFDGDTIFLTKKNIKF